MDAVLLLRKPYQEWRRREVLKPSIESFAHPAFQSRNMVVGSFVYSRPRSLVLKKRGGKNGDPRLLVGPEDTTQVLCPKVWTEDGFCPVCGYAALGYPPEDFAICPSCGAEFGYHDSNKTHAELRAEWMNRGLPCSSRVIERPAVWNGLRQLQSVGLAAGREVSVRV